MAIKIARTGGRGGALSSAERALITDSLASSGQVSLLAPSRGACDRLRRELVAAGIGIGIETSVVSAWIAELWKLLGDGTRPVEPIERQLLIFHVMRARDAQDLAPLRATPGTGRLLARIARDLSPWALEGSFDADDACDARVRELLVDYDRQLADHQLIETAQAARKLSQVLSGRLAGRPRCIVLRDVTELPAHLLDLLATIGSDGEVHVLLNRDQWVLAEELRRALSGRGASAVDLIDLCSEQGREARGKTSGASFAHGATPDAKPAFLEVAGAQTRPRAYVERIVAQLCRTGARRPRVAVISPAAGELFDDLAERLASAGVRATGTRVTAFEQTALGRQLTALVDLTEHMDAARAGTASAGAWWPAPELVDWLISPLSGADQLSARRFDKRIRGNRTLGPDDALRELQSIQSRLNTARSRRSPDSGRAQVPCVCSDVMRFIATGRLAAAVRAMGQVAAALPAGAFGVSDGMVRVLQERAIADRTLEAITQTARALGVPQQVATDALSGLAVATPVEAAAATDVDQIGEAIFLTPSDAALLSAGAVDAVFFADVDQTSYPLKRQSGPLEALAATLGATGVALEPVARLRDLFSRIMLIAPVTALARVTHDRHARDRYPAAIWTELRVRAGGPVPDVVGERKIADDMDAVGIARARVERVGCTDPQQVGAAAASYLIPRHREPIEEGSSERRQGSPDGTAPSLVPRQLSASQIETYLGCPLCWFVSQRIRPQRLDAGFTGMEKGNFVHDVMDRFHERLIREGLRRVTHENVEASLTLLDEEFEAVRARHADGKTATSGALVAHSRTEELEVLDIRAQLHDVVRFEAAALAAFAPRYLEYSFNGLGVSYAGWPLGGRIDRVDVDASGRAVVIDYKHRAYAGQFALSDPTVPDKLTGVAAADDPRWLPEHTQTLIYAQAIRRALGLDVRAALYLTTKGAPGMRGAADDALIEQEPGDGRIPGLRRGFPGEEEGGSCTFDDLLERVEAGIAIRLDELRAGLIAAADPASPSCSYNHPFGFCRREA